MYIHGPSTAAGHPKLIIMPVSTRLIFPNLVSHHQSVAVASHVTSFDTAEENLGGRAYERQGSQSKPHLRILIQADVLHSGVYQTRTLTRGEYYSTDLRSRYVSQTCHHQSATLESDGASFTPHHNRTHITPHHVLVIIKSNLRI
jgi:hypothetical protein